ncbi:MAG TPA: DNA alkylation repair protein [Fodinibius sp.]|nr:DNA alkylation repair protein [Fodinibius sp.]
MAYKKPTDYFDEELANLLSNKINLIYRNFDDTIFVNNIKAGCTNKRLKERVTLIAEQLRSHLPDDYSTSLEILIQILGPENQEEIGMFTRFYWIMPVAKYVELYGLDHFDLSISAIEEITKRNTGEYAIRPFIRKYPDQTLEKMREWALDNNFHLRRLASEGLRPRLPWATKLELFIDQPDPVFEILHLLKEDTVHFVKKSVANHITDYLKVNPPAARQLIAEWQSTENKHTQWILKYAQRKL